MIRVDWSERKSRLNALKHNVTFEEAQTIFDDPSHLTVADPDHSIGETRFITIGFSDRNRLLIMAHTFENDKIRLISARKPTRSERRRYEEGVFDA